MAESAQLILQAIQNSTGTSVDSEWLSTNLKVDHQKIVGGIKSLEAVEGLITTQESKKNQWVLTPDGQEKLTTGSDEYCILQAVPDSVGILKDELNASHAKAAEFGFPKAMQFGWVKLDKNAAGGARVFRRVDVQTTPDKTKLLLQLLSNNEASQVPNAEKAELKKRKLAQEVSITTYTLQKGPNFRVDIAKDETDLVPEMLLKNTWKQKVFKPYNFNAWGAAPQGGHFHPLMKVKSEFRQIFLEMGFSEMQTNNYVENSFWNFDALFQPQDHPARDMQDTFFVSHPATSENFPDKYVQRVKKVHSTGDYGSQGYQTEWRMSEAKKNVLRTHTTAVSARVLYKLAQEAAAACKQGSGVAVKPCKYFSIDRVFRNETLDATHLAEFHQIEGVAGGPDFSMAHMIGIFTAFFSKLGLVDLRFKPTYNPYTEPSMEIYAYHSGLKKYVEIGNSGMFRPEMLRPMGLPEGYRVAGWGLSLERPTMILYGIDNIRDLCGHKIDLQMVYDSPICVFKAKKPALTEKKLGGGDDRSKAAAGVHSGGGSNVLQSHDDGYFDKHHDNP